MTQLLSREQAAGATFDEAGRVRSYGSAAAEHAAVRRHAGLRDVTTRARLRLTGSDRAAWLHGLCTQDVRGLAVGHGAPAACINDVGRLLFDFTVYARAEELLLELDGVLKDKAMAWLDHHLITEDVTIEDVSASWLALELAGPLAAGLLSVSVSPAYGVAEVEGDLWLGRPGLAVPGWQVWTRPGRLGGLWDRLAASARPFGEEAWDTLRLEAGTPVYGVDMGEDNNPLEAGLHHAVSLDKGCYTGQEVLARLTFRQGPVRVLMGLKSEDPLVAGEELLADGKAMARVTSAGVSPTLGHPIAMGYVRRECKTPGTKLWRQASVPVEVVELPWV